MSKETLKEAISLRLESQGHKFELIELNANDGSYFLTFKDRPLLAILITGSCLWSDDLDAIRDMIKEHMP